MKIDNKILARIISCDVRYVGHKDDNTVVLRDGGLNVSMTHEEYCEDHDISIEEVMFATMDDFLESVKNTNITPTSDVVNVLLDVRSLLGKLADQKKEFISGLLRMNMEDH